MSSQLLSNVVLTCAGVMLVTAIMMVWRRRLSGVAWLLGVQGVALSCAVAAVGYAHHHSETILMALIVLVLKAVVFPWLLLRGDRHGAHHREDARTSSPALALLVTALLTVLAYLVSRPILAALPGPTASSVPVGMALVLIGFLLLVTRRRAISQIAGFMLIDNGIATVSFLAAGGLPLVVELGVSIDVALVAVILQVLTYRMRAISGTSTVDSLTELKD